MKMKSINKLFSIVITAILAFAIALNYTAPIKANSDDTYFHTSDEETEFTYYLTAYEYEEYGEEFIDVGVEFQLSADGRKYYVTNTEFVDELLLEISEMSLSVEKYNKPTITKKVKVDRLSEYQEKLYASTDETLTLQIILDINESNYKDFVICDTLPSELVKVSNATVQLNPDKSNKKSTLETLVFDKDNPANSDYIYDETKNTYKINSSKVNLTKTSQIIITYNVTIGTYSNNTESPVALETKAYGEYKTPNNVTEQITESIAKITVAKLLVTESSDNTTLFENVSFQLYDLEDPNNPKPILMRESSSSSASSLVCYAVDKTSTSTTLEMKEFKNLVVLGLIPGKNYRLEFTSRPEGSEKLVKTYDFKWNEETNMMSIVLEDLERLEIVDTGGVGTTGFYLLGGILVLSSLLVLKKRKASCLNNHS